MKKGKEIKKHELTKYDSKFVFVTFDFSDITYLGETEEEMDQRYEKLKKEYPEGIYKVDGQNKCLQYIDSDRIPLAFQHNLIDKIYEIIEEDNNDKNA